jgi:hypothetical protein
MVVVGEAVRIENQRESDIDGVCFFLIYRTNL